MRESGDVGGHLQAPCIWDGPSPSPLSRSPRGSPRPGGRRQGQLVRSGPARALRQLQGLKSLALFSPSHLGTSIHDEGGGRVRLRPVPSRAGSAEPPSSSDTDAASSLVGLIRVQASKGWRTRLISSWRTRASLSSPSPVIPRQPRPQLAGRLCWGFCPWKQAQASGDSSSRPSRALDTARRRPPAWGDARGPGGRDLPAPRQARPPGGAGRQEVVDLLGPVLLLQ